MKKSNQKEEIEKFLKNYKYIQLKKNEYEVWGDFDENIFDAPVKIKILHGNLTLSDLKIKSFKNKYLPYIIFGRLYVDNNENLKNLIGLPKIVLGTFSCEGNDSLISLKGSPKIVGGNFMGCQNMKLKSLKYGPEIVIGWFDVSFSNIISVKYLPKFIGKYLMIYGTKKKFKRSDVYKYSHVNETIFVTSKEASYEEEFPEND